MNQRSGRGGGGNNYAEREAQKQRALVTVQPPRLPMPKEAGDRGINNSRWQALTDAVWPAAKSVAGVLLALDYCEARKLDPFKKVVHIVPMWSTALGREVETVWPGIGELRTTATRTGVYAGNDEVVFGRILRQDFKDQRTSEGRNDSGPRVTTASCDQLEFPEYAQMTVYRIVSGVRVPFVGPKVFFVETFSGEKGLRVPNSKWRMSPRQMLEKCAEAAALRRAFPEELAGENTADEMEGKVLQADAAVHAVYSEVDTSEPVTVDQQQASDEQQQDPAQEQQQDGERDLNGWNPKNLASYMKGMAKALPKVATLDALESMLQGEQDAIDSLPAEEAEAAAALIAAARERLQAVREQFVDKGGDDRQDDDADVDGDRPQADGTTDGTPAAAEAEGEEPAFVRNFRKRVAEVELIVDLAGLEKSEKRAIDAQPGGVARACDRIIAERRAALQG